VAFINRFRQTYHGIETPYELNAAAPSTEKKDEKKKDEKDEGF
jgi:hypothetical protein